MADPVGVTIGRIWSTEKGPRDLIGFVEEEDGQITIRWEDAVIVSNEEMEFTFRVKMSE